MRSSISFIVSAHQGDSASDARADSNGKGQLGGATNQRARWQALVPARYRCHGGGLRGFATVGGLKWHAMRVGRLLRSTEGVGVELQRVAGWHRVAGSRNRGVTESQRIAHASRLAVTTGEALWVVSKQSVAELSLCTSCRVTAVSPSFSISALCSSPKNRVSADLRELKIVCC
eukprot:scaffold38077_cov48-Phaeocystis_antarctica.AAC.1